MGYSFPYLNESSALTNQTENVDLFQHVQSKHGADQQLPEVICPICAAMINGEPNLVTGDLISHIANDHQQSQSNTPSSTNEGMNAYSRPVLPNREYDFGIGAAIRGGFRRGSSRVPSRRGGGGGTTRGGGSSNGSAGQHFIVDTTGFSPNAHGNDPIADLLTQLSNVRRMAAANNNNNSNNTNSNTLSVTPNTINLQTLTRQQYERERLRAALSRSHQHYQSSNSPQPPIMSLQSKLTHSILYFLALYISIHRFRQMLILNNNQTIQIHRYYVDYVINHCQHNCLNQMLISCNHYFCRV